LSPFISSTLAFHSCFTLNPNTRSKINGKYKEEEEQPKLNYLKLQHGMKTTPKTLHISLFREQRGYL